MTNLGKSTTLTKLGTNSELVNWVISINQDNATV